jgi:hypothetical protein
VTFKFKLNYKRVKLFLQHVTSAAARPVQAAALSLKLCNGSTVQVTELPG